MRSLRWRVGYQTHEAPRFVTDQKEPSAAVSRVSELQGCCGSSHRSILGQLSLLCISCACRCECKTCESDFSLQGTPTSRRRRGCASYYYSVPDTRHRFSLAPAIACHREVAVSCDGSETCATVCAAHVMPCHSSETCVYRTGHGEVHLRLNGLTTIGCVRILLPVQECPGANQLNPV